MQLIEHNQIQADSINIIKNYYDLIQNMIPDETYALLNTNYEVVNADKRFNNIFNNAKSSINSKFQELETVSHQSPNTLNKLSAKLLAKTNFNIVIFTNINSVVKPLSVQFNYFASGWYIKVQRYSSYNILSQVIQSSDKEISNEIKQKVLIKLKKLNDFQLTICYLMAHNFSNQRITDIINDLTPDAKPKTKNAIAVKIERIRRTLDINSKVFLTECLLAVNVIQEYPRLLFANKMFIFEIQTK